MAFEPFPGRTPYTRGSELQNAETSAWGRAIVAALAADTNRAGVASADEVRNRRADEEAIEKAKSEQPTMTKVELVKHLRSICFDIWKRRGGEGNEANQNGKGEGRKAQGPGGDLESGLHRRSWSRRGPPPWDIRLSTRVT